jgi:hypothetical protein
MRDRLPIFRRTLRRTIAKAGPGTHSTDDKKGGKQYDSHWDAGILRCVGFPGSIFPPSQVLLVVLGKALAEAILLPIL